MPLISASFLFFEFTVVPSGCLNGMIYRPEPILEGAVGLIVDLVKV
jgi:hypothetical protein